MKDVPSEVIKIIDIKCPDSGESAAVLWENCDFTGPEDQFKFVVASRADFDWAGGVCAERGLARKCTVLYSPVYGRVKPADLARWILDAKSDVTMQLQMHKEIWGGAARGGVRVCAATPAVR